MPVCALLEYVVTQDATHVLLVKEGFDHPLVLEARDENGGLPRKALELCAKRLLIDFHGMPPDWDLKPNPELHAALSLTPAVSAARRSKGILERNLTIPAFHYEMDYWTKLGRLLFPAQLRPHLEDCELLVIIPHGPLHALPFAALEWSENTFLIERFGLSLAPSLSTLRFCQANNPRRSQDTPRVLRNAVAVAIAAADDQNPALFEADPERLVEILRNQTPPVPLVQMVGAKQQDGRLPASKAGTIEQLPGHDLIHLACHGVFGGDQHLDPLDSGFLVSNGETVLSLSAAAAMTPQDRHHWILSARDIFALHLRADLITLRACSSGRSALEPGDELLGITRALLYAGAISLIASLWNVNQKSSQLLLSTFYEVWMRPQPTAVAAPVPKWKALQQAQIALLRGDYPHPFHWAPFVLIGDWV
jgi:CHAT domain-containing protein